MHPRFFGIGLIFIFAVQVSARPLCLAHRGEHDKHGENSIEGIREAINMGADGVEVDLRHTSDGVAMGIHDKILWRIAKSKPGRQCPRFTLIENLASDEIRDNCILKNSEEISTLDEILNTAKESNSFVLIQMKDAPSNQTIRLIGDFPNKDRLRVHSFWDSILNRFEVLSQRAGYHVKTLKLSKYFPWLSGTRGNDLSWPYHWLVDLAKLRQHEVGLFLVESEETMKKAINLNVDFITTNNPAICGATHR